MFCYKLGRRELAGTTSLGSVEIDVGLKMEGGGNNTTNE
jgi:hypothetical protein